MTTQKPDPGRGAAAKTVRRIRGIGMLVMAIAVVSAIVVYWRGREAQKLFDDPFMGGFDKANQRQMEIMYGKMGTLTEDLFQQLKQPRTQAAIILIGGGLISAGCFYFARLVGYGDESEVSEPAEGTCQPKH